MLSLILGPMMAGKSTELSRRLQGPADAGLRVAYVNSVLDTRTDTAFSCHDPSRTLPLNISAFKTSALTTVDPRAYDVIGVDEGQFFGDLVENVREWIVEHRKTVIVAALSGSYAMQPIGDTHLLLCLHPDVTMLTAICYACAKRKAKSVPARYTRLLVNAPTDGFLIGGANEYQPVCLDCHRERA